MVSSLLFLNPFLIEKPTARSKSAKLRGNPRKLKSGSNIKPKKEQRPAPKRTRQAVKMANPPANDISWSFHDPSVACAAVDDCQMPSDTEVQWVSNISSHNLVNNHMLIT